MLRCVSTFIFHRAVLLASALFLVQASFTSRSVELTTDKFTQKVEKLGDSPMALLYSPRAFQNWDKHPPNPYLVFHRSLVEYFNTPPIWALIILSFVSSILFYVLFYYLLQKLAFTEWARDTLMLTILLPGSFELGLTSSFFLFLLFFNATTYLSIGGHWVLAGLGAAVALLLESKVPFYMPMWLLIFFYLERGQKPMDLVVELVKFVLPVVFVLLLYPQLVPSSFTFFEKSACAHYYRLVTEGKFFEQILEWGEVRLSLLLGALFVGSFSALIRNENWVTRLLPGSGFVFMMVCFPITAVAGNLILGSMAFLGLVPLMNKWIFRIFSGFLWSTGTYYLYSNFS